MELSFTDDLRAAKPKAFVLSVTRGRWREQREAFIELWHIYCNFAEPTEHFRGYSIEKVASLILFQNENATFSCLNIRKFG